MPAPSDLIHETATSTGTGDFTLVAVNGKRTFNTGFGTGGTDLFDYYISSRDAAEWERGTGHMSDATTLVRDTVLASSNAGAAVSFAAGTKDVTNDIPAAKQVTTDTVQTLSNKTLDAPALGTPVSGDLTNCIGAHVKVAAVATTSGSTIDFTGIPSHVTCITITADSLSTNSTSPIQIQIGDSGGVETSGYNYSLSTLTNVVVTSNYTSGAVYGATTASSLHSGVLFLNLIDATTNTWSFGAVFTRADFTANYYGAGSKSLSATLDRIRLTTVGGTATFDNGSIAISYS